MRKENDSKPRTMIDEVPVYCGYDEIIDIGKAVPNPNNPNHHPHSQIELLAKIIKAQGWRQPITISNRSGLIVKGHGRLLAAIHLDADKIPVEYQNYETEAEEIADLTADNRLSELSEMDNDTLVELLQDLEAEDFDLELAGYTEEDMEELLKDLTTMDDPLDDEDEEETIQTTARPGDIFLLGNHQLICADAEDPEDVKNLHHINEMLKVWEDATGKKAVLVLRSDENEDVGGSFS